MRLLNTAIQYDHLSFSWCQQRCRRKHLVALSRRVSRSADGYLYLLLALLAIAHGYYRFFELVVLSLFLERGLYFVLKTYTKRNRPPDKIPGFQSIIQASDKFSFPSGHTSAAFLMATLLSAHMPVMAALLYPWACCVAWARVMLGVHFPSDTLAGAALGSTVALYCMGLDFTFLNFLQ